MPTRQIRTRMFRSPVGLAATVVVAGAAVAGGTAGAIQLTAGPAAVTAPSTTPPLLDPTPTPTATAPGTAAPAPTATSARPTPSGQRAARGTTRTSRSSRTSAPEPGTRSPTSRVVGSGSCGASYYDEPQPTANGETFDPEAFTAAHKTLPFNTRVRVINPANSRSVTVRINDRGPYVDGRCLDLSRAAFRSIGSLDQGHLTVRYEILSSSAR